MELSTSSTINTGLRGKAYQQPRILIVDDEENILSALSSLTRNQFPETLVATASTAEQALEMAEAAPVDVLLTDFRLPKIDGLELSRLIRERFPQTRVILMTAYGSDGMVSRSQADGCLAYIEKPLDMDLLTELMADALDERQQFTCEFSGMSLSDIIQFYSIKGKSVVLTVGTPGATGLVYIESGQITHAAYQDKIGAEALLDILEAGPASVNTIVSQRSHKKTLSLDWRAIDAVLQAPSRDERLRRAINPVCLTSHGAHSPKRTRQEHGLGDIIRNFQDECLTTNKLGTLRIEQTHTSRERPEFSGPNSTGNAMTLDIEEEDTSDSAAANCSDAEFERKKRIQYLVNRGVELFRERRLEGARKYWTQALGLDPDCRQAKKNLEILEKSLTRTTSG